MCVPEPIFVAGVADFEREFGAGPATLIRERSDQLARDRNAYARRLLKDRLPRPLHFLIDRPRALGWLFRVAPRLRPTMTVVDLRCQERWDGIDPTAPMTAEAAREMGRHWVMAMRATSGATVPDGGLIFTYTDPSGLPAEVYGDLR